MKRIIPFLFILLLFCAPCSAREKIGLMVKADRDIAHHDMVYLRNRIIDEARPNRVEINDGRSPGRFDALLQVVMTESRNYSASGTVIYTSGASMFHRQFAVRGLNKRDTLQRLAEKVVTVL